MDQVRNPRWLTWLYVALVLLVVAVFGLFAWLSSLPENYF